METLGKPALRDYHIEDNELATEGKIQTLVESIKSNGYTCTLCLKSFVGNSNYKSDNKRIRIHAAQHFTCYTCKCGHLTRVRDTMAIHSQRKFKNNHNIYYRIDEV